MAIIQQTYTTEPVPLPLSTRVCFMTYSTECVNLVRGDDKNPVTLSSDSQITILSKLMYQLVDDEFKKWLRKGLELSFSIERTGNGAIEITIIVKCEIDEFRRTIGHVPS